jgi:hypothetical protein
MTPGGVPATRKVPLLRVQGTATAEEVAAVLAALSSRPPRRCAAHGYEQWRRTRQLAREH